MKIGLNLSKLSGQAWACLFGVSLLFQTGCAGPQEQIVMTRQGRRAKSEQIDQERWGLLPAGALLWAEVDARQLGHAEYGKALFDFVRAEFPLLGVSGIDPMKDVDRVRLGFYASQSGDLAAVLEGRFDGRAIETALAQSSKTPKGDVIEHRRYAGSDVLRAGALSMSLLTPSTLVLGTEVGVRRILERVEEGRIRRALPSWFEAMLEDKSPAFFLGIDLDAQPVPATLRTQFTFLNQLRGSRIVGKFEPGLSMAGSLSYDSPEAAHKALGTMDSQVAELNRAAFLLAILRVPRPLRQFEAQENGKKVDFAADVDARAVSMAVGYLGQLGDQLSLR